MANKILFAINSLAGGGAERVFARLVAASEPYLKGRELVIALLDREAIAYPLPGWVRVVQLDCRHGMKASAAALRALVRRERPAAMLSFLTRANVAGGFATLGENIRWVASERVDTDAHLGRGLRALPGRLLVRLAYPRADCIIAVSEGVAEGLWAHFGVKRERTITVANPIDVAFVQRQAAADPEISVPDGCIVGIGRLVANKNFDLLIRAFAGSGTPAKLLILGEGPERARLAALAAELGRGGDVLMPGFVANPYALLARAGFFVLSSNAEGFPNALVEAMAIGTPVIATNCASGPSEILADRPRGSIDWLTETGAGIVVPPNDLAAMVEAFALMEDGARRDRLGAGGKARAADFSVDRAVRAYWQAIDGC